MCALSGHLGKKAGFVGFLCVGFAVKTLDDFVFVTRGKCCFKTLNKPVLGFHEFIT